MKEQEDEDPVLPPLGQLHVVVNPLPPANCVQSDFVDPVKLDHLSQDQAHLLAPVATAEHLRAAAEVPDEVFQWQVPKQDQQDVVWQLKQEGEGVACLAPYVQKFWFSGLLQDTLAEGQTSDQEQEREQEQMQEYFKNQNQDRYNDQTEVKNQSHDQELDQVKEF